MDFNKLSAADKRLALLAVGVIVGGLAGVADDWGTLATIGLLAGIGVAGVIFQPQLMPNLKLPIARNQLIFGLAVAAVVCFVLAGLGGLSFLFDFTSIPTLLFDIGIIASLALAWFAWLDFKSANPEIAARMEKAVKPAAAAPAATVPAATPAPAPARVAAPEPVTAPAPAAAPEPVAEAEPVVEADEPLSAAAADEPADEPEMTAAADAAESPADAPEADEEAPKAG